MTGGARSGLLALLLVGLALVVAWLLPALAIPIVWPLFLVVPGWALMAWTRPRLASTARLGLAVVLSVAVSTHLVWWLSFLGGGYGRLSVFVAAAILAAPIPAAAWRCRGFYDLRGVAQSAWRALRRQAAGFALAATTALFVGGVLAAGIWQVGPAGIDSGGSNWSDLGVHLAIAQSVNAGNFPPEVPYFAGAPLVYHWFADFHAAILARSADLFAIPVFVVQAAVLAAALALLVHGLAMRLFGGATRRRAALLASLLVVAGGGLGWLRLLGDLASGLGNPIELVTANGYDNQWLTGWPFFRIPAVLTTGLLVHRATMAGLPMAVASVLLVCGALPSAAQRRAGHRDRPPLMLLAGVIGALLAPFHFFYFPVVPVLVLAWAGIGGRLGDRSAWRSAALFLAPYLLAIPFAVAPLLQAAGSGALKWVVGWESAPALMADGLAAVAFFYLTNLGIPFMLALGALVLPGTPRRWFLAAWVVLLFAIPNLVQVSVIGFDMNKYFQAMWIAVALLAGWLLARWPTPLVAAALALSIASPMLAAAWTGLSRFQVLSSDQVAVAEWIARATPERSVFVTDGWVNSPTDAAGRLRLTTFAPYIANLGYSPDLRLVQVAQIYCGGDPDRSASLMRDLGATYVIDGGRPSPCDAPVSFADSSAFEAAFSTPTVQVYRLSSGP